jgi:hypothetical protein
VKPVDKDPYQAAQEAVASLRLDGVAPSADAVALLEQVAGGELTSQDVADELIARYRARP